jgi:hypothetical protein
MAELSQLQFGEIDARNEVFQQARQNSRVFFNSFQVPPGLSISALEGGARFFVLGQKGTGKTALIWYLRELAVNNGGKGEVVLFKSDLTEVERQRITNLGEAIVFSDQGKIEPLYDYKQNWLWFIIRSLVRMVDDKDVLFGKDLLHDLRELTGVNKSAKQTIFSGLQFTKIKTNIDAGLKLGVFRSDLKTEIEAVFAPKSPDILEVIAVCERAIGQIKLVSPAKCSLFFDELELFLNKEDQRNRDLFLIRDLLYAVSRINRGFGHDNNSFVVYASVRSEVLQEVNRVGPETKKDVTDFGVNISWDAKVVAGSQPILSIIEAKVNASELEIGDEETQDVWREYFPFRIYGKSFQNYLLDISMHKPRNLVRRLRLAQEANRSGTKFNESDFDASGLNFSADVWSEMEEDLSSTYDPRQISAIKSILSGFTARFTIGALEDRIISLSKYDNNVYDSISRKVPAVSIASDLYRIGAVGNVFIVQEGKKKYPRNRWIFRGYTEPLLDREFVVHDSLRKAFQLSHE